MNFALIRQLLILFCFSALSSCLNNNQNIIEDEIESLGQTFAPDKRVALFDIQLQQAGGEGFVLKGETNLKSVKNELLQKLEQQRIPFIDSIELLPSKRLNGNHWGIVNISVCNIRSQPQHSAELATQSLLGTPLRVLKKQGEWYLIQTPDDYIGWLDQGGLILMNDSLYADWQKAPKAIYTESFGFTYNNPNEEGVISNLSSGNLLHLVDQSEDHSRVLFPDKRTAFVRNSEITSFSEWLKSRQPTAENIIQSAYEFMGRPYLWGGTSGNGMDCSGFTKMVFYMNGLLLARDASQQVHTGKPIETDTTLKNLMAGDLLFFGKKATQDQKERISHVAIYLGEGKIIHSSGRVQIQSLRRGDPDFVEERLTTFIRAKRPLVRPEEYDIPYLKNLPFYCCADE